MEKRGPGRKVATVNRYLGVLKAAFTLAVRNGKAEKNPVSTVELGKENNRRVRWLSEDEEVLRLGVLSRNHQALVLVALHTGMRKGEQLSLRWTDIDFHQRRLTIRESKSGGGQIYSTQ